MCHSSQGWKQQINCLARGHTVRLGSCQDLNTCSTLSLICDIRDFLRQLPSSAFERIKVFVSLCWEEKKKTPSWFSLIMRSVKQCSVHFWPNSVFPSLLSVLHCTEHTQLETAQTMHVRLRQHFLQHLLFGRKGLLQEWCKKMEQFCTAWH